MSSRLIDPRRHIERGTDEAHGLLTARELEHQIDTGRKIDAESDRTQRIIIFETIELHTDFVPANASVGMAHMIVASSTQVNLVLVSGDVGEQCRICAFRLMASIPITAGTVTPAILLNEGGTTTVHQFNECQINGTDPQTKSQTFAWSIAPQVAKTASWTVSITTSPDYAPATVDYKAMIVFGYDQWI